ncbi:HNH endonuclease [Vibrio phage D184]
MKIGDVYKTNNCGKVKVIEYKSNQEVKVEFLDTKFSLWTAKWCILAGKVKDKLKPSLCGVGIVGCGKYKASVNRERTPAFRFWREMICRCYGVANLKRRPTYENVTVCDEWLNFQNFADWFHENYPDDGVNICLDKDIKIPGNKVYRPEACSFTTREENTFKCSEWKRKNFALLNVVSMAVVRSDSFRKFESIYGLDRKKISDLVNEKISSYQNLVLLKPYA